MKSISIIKLGCLLALVFVPWSSHVRVGNAFASGPSPSFVPHFTPHSNAPHSTSHFDGIQESTHETTTRYHPDEPEGTPRYHASERPAAERAPREAAERPSAAELHAAELRSAEERRTTEERRVAEERRAAEELRASEEPRAADQDRSQTSWRTTRRHVRTIAELDPTAYAGAPHTVATVVVMADSEHGYRNMYGADPTTSQLSEVERFTRIFRAAGATLVTKEDGDEHDFMTAVRAAAAKSEIVTIIGHVAKSVWGDSEIEIILPSGKRVSAAHLTHLIPSANLVFITCYSKDVDPDAPISLDDAHAVWAYATEGYGNPAQAVKDEAEQHTANTGDAASAIPPASEHAANTGDAASATASASEHTANTGDAASATASTSDPKLGADMAARLHYLVSRANHKLTDYPRVQIVWTTVDRGAGRWLLAVESEFHLPGGWLAVLLPFIIGHCLLLLIMLTIPHTGTTSALRPVLRTVLRRRRNAIAISGSGSVIVISSLLCAGLWSWLRRSGQAAPEQPFILWSCALGIAQSLLSYSIARTVPFGSRTGRAAHFMGGFLTGAWAAPLVGTIVGALPALLFAAMHLLLGDREGALIDGGAILGGIWFFLLPVFCPQAGIAASKGKSIYHHVRGCVAKTVGNLRFLIPPRASTTRCDEGHQEPRSRGERGRDEGPHRGRDRRGPPHRDVFLINGLRYRDWLRRQEATSTQPSAPTEPSTALTAPKPSADATSGGAQRRRK